MPFSMSLITFFAAGLLVLLKVDGAKGERAVVEKSLATDKHG